MPGTKGHVIVRRGHDDHLPLHLIEGSGGRAEALLWPGVGATERAFHRIHLRAGARTVTQRHPNSEAVYFVVSGTGSVLDEDTGSSHRLRARNVVFATPRTAYKFAAETDLLVVGGPCPAEPSTYDSADRATVVERET